VDETEVAKLREEITMLRNENEQLKKVFHFPFSLNSCVIII
jgi:hypothetical protein